jgi:hypothetical protein
MGCPQSDGWKPRLRETSRQGRGARYKGEVAEAAAGRIANSSERAQQDCAPTFVDEPFPALTRRSTLKLLQMLVREIHEPCPVGLEQVVRAGPKMIADQPVVKYGVGRGELFSGEAL